MEMLLHRMRHYLIVFVPFQANEILVAYQEELERYMATPDAVYDGSAKRYEKSVDLLLDKIANCETLITAPATLHLVNDGTSWKLDDSDPVLGDAILGTLSTTPVDDTETE